MKITDEDVKYEFDPKRHCGDGSIRNTFCIVGPGHFGHHWDGTREWAQASDCCRCRYIGMKKPLASATGFCLCECHK